MLILSRKKGEQIVIRDNIVITVTGIRKGNVRLGIEAPPDVAVHREEIHRVIQEGGLDRKVDGELGEIRQLIHQGNFPEAVRLYRIYRTEHLTGPGLSNQDQQRLANYQKSQEQNY